MDEMPEHDHDASTTAGGAHSHTLEITSSVSTGVSGISSNVIAPAQNTVYNDEIIQDEAAHIHALTVQGDAANNLVDMRQPSIVMGYVIYSGVIP
jgi:microcystin-dependent protein